MFKQTNKTNLSLLVTKHLSRGFRFVLFLVALTGVFLYTRAGTPARVEAATSSEINFQARLLGSTGVIVADGYYNVEFNLYSVSSGGTTLWTETYYDSNGVTAGNDNRVQVKTGYLSVHLGSLTSFPSTIPWDQDLYLTMNIGGTTQTATPTYDGEMTPRLKLTSVPYAFQAGRAEQLAKTIGGNLGQVLFPGTLGQATNYNLIDPGVASVNICLSSGNCAGQGGSVAGTGTQNRIAYWDQLSGTHLGDSYLVQSASALTLDNGKNLVINTDTLFVDATNNIVGIGDATPDGKLGVVLTSTSTTADTARGISVSVSDTGIVTTGTDTTYGQQLSVTRTGATGGTINAIGLDISVTGDGGGTSTTTGLRVNVSGADTNYAATFQGGNVGINTSTPSEKLAVVSDDNGSGTNIVSIKSNNLTQGIGIGYNTIRSIGSNSAVSLFLDAKGAGNILLQTGGSTGGVGISASTFGTNNKLIVNPYNTVDNLATAQISTNAATNKGLVVQGFASQSAELFQLQDSSGNINAAFNAAGNQLTLGRIAGSGTVTQGKLLFSDGTTSSFGTTLQTATLTTGSRTITIPNTAGVNDTVCLLTLSNCAGSVTSTGTVNRIPVFTPDGNTLGDSYFLQSAGAVTLDANKNFVYAAGTGTFDQSASSGVFKTGTGAVSLNGDTTIAGSKTFTTGTGAVTLQGATSVNGSNTFTVGTGLATFGSFVKLSANNTFIQGVRTDTSTVNLIGVGSDDYTAVNSSGSVLGVKIKDALGATLVTVLNGGNFGIGDTTPAALFTVGNGDLFQVNSAGAIAASTGIANSGGYIQSGSTANTFTGLSTFQGGLTVTTGQNFTVNGDVFTDLTGSGLTVSSGALTVDATSSTGFFRNGGNTFGVAGDLGTNDAFALNLRTNGTTKLTVSTTGDLTFAQGANRTLNVAANSTANGAGYNLTFAAGAADGTAAGNVGGVLALQGGAAAGSGNNNGGNITIDGGAKTGSGTKGYVVLQGAGGNVGIGTSTPTAAGLTVATAGAASLSAIAANGTWFTGGTSTTTKPYVLLEPSGATSTNWSTNGTGLGINAANGFTGNLLDLQTNGISRAKIDAYGRQLLGGTYTSAPAGNFVILSPSIDLQTGGSTNTFSVLDFQAGVSDNGNYSGVIRGGVIDVYNFGSSNTVSSMLGLQITGGQRINGGTVSNLTLLDIAPNNNSGTVTNLTGIHVAQPGSGSTLGTVYGMQIDAITRTSTNNYGLWIGGASGGATNNYSLYVNSGSSYFGGTIQYANGTTNTDAVACRNSSGQLAACNSTFATTPASGSYIKQVPATTADNTIAPTAASVVALTVKGTTGTAARVLEIYDSTATPALQAYFDATGSLNVSKLIQPTANNTIDLGLTGTQFRTGYFGTSVLTPMLDTNSATALNIGTATQNALTLGRVGASTTINGNTSSSIALGNFTVSAAGAIVGVGVNSGTGLIQGTGGATIAGTTQINASGGSNTTIGNSAGGTITIGASSGSDLILNDANWSVTGAGAATFSSGTISGAGTFTSGTGTVLLQGNTDIANTVSLATKRGADYTTAGSANNVAISTASLYRLDTSGAAQTLTGIAAGRDGQYLTLVSADASLAFTLNNLDGASSAANQISTGTGNNLSVPAGSSVSLIYDAASSLWRVVGSAGVTGGFANQQLSNLSGTVAVNLALNPGTDNTLDLGSAANSWRTLYADTSVLAPTIDTATAATLNIGTTTANAVSISKTGVTTTVNGALAVTQGSTFTGLGTFNGGITLLAGQTLTVNSDAITDLTGSGIVLASNALTVDATSATGFFRNGGNNFGGNATLGTTGAGQTLGFETAGTTRAILDATGNLTFQQASIISTGANNLTLTSANFNVAGATGTITTNGGYTQSGVVANTFTGATSFTAAGTALSVTNNATISGTATIGTVATNTITPSGALTVGATGQSFLLQGSSASTLTATNGSFKTTVGFTTPTANATLNFPALVAGTYEICTDSGNCNGAGATLQTAYNNSTPSPEIKLDSTRGALTIQDANTTIGATANLFEILNSNAAATLLKVQGNGNVGIGTSGNPAQLLSVGGTTGNFIVTSAGNTVVGGTLGVTGNSTLTGTLTVNSTSALNGAVTITGAANTVQLKIKANSTQTGANDLLQLTASNGTSIYSGFDTTGSLYFKDQVSGFTSTISVQDNSLSASNKILTLPNASGEICTTSGNCIGNGGSGDVFKNGQTGPLVIGTTDNTDFTLITNNTSRIYIKNDGKVGIGTNSTPSSLLSVGTGTGAFTVDTSGNIATTGTYNTNTFTSSQLVFGAASGASVSSANNQNLTLQTQGSGTLALNTGSGGVLTTNAATIRRTAAGTTAIDLLDASADTTLSVTNSDGTRLANLSVEGSITAGTGLTVTTGGATINGLLTANNGITLVAGQTLTVNTDAVTDLTGSGIVLSSGALTVDASSATGFFRNGGNSFGATTKLGTNDAQDLIFRTNNGDRLTLTQTGDLTFAGSNTIGTSLTNGTLTINSNGTGALTLDSGTTGAIDIGTNANAKTITIGNSSGATALNFNTGTGGISLGSNGTANTIQIGNTSGAVAQTINIGNNATGSSTSTVVIGSTVAGNVTLQSAATISIGNNAAAQTLNIGNTTGATALNLRAGTGNFSLDGVAGTTYALGASTTTGTITIGGSAQTGAISLGTGAGAGSRDVTVGSTANASTLTLQSGTGNLSITTQGTGVLGIGNNAVAQTIQVGNSTGTTSVAIAAGTGGLTIQTQGTGTLGIGNNAVAQNIVVGNITGGTGLTERVGTGNYSLDGVTNSTYTLGASTTTGTFSIGGTAQTGDITLGSSSGTNQVLIGNGAGATTVNIANANAAGAVNIGGSFVAGTITIGGTAQTGTISLGQSTDSNTVNIANATIANTKTGTVNIATSATGASGKTAVTIGSTNAASSVLIQGGTGNVQIQSQGGTLGIGNNAVAQTIVIGNTTGATALTLQSGSAGIVVNGVLAATANSAALCRDTSTGKLTACDANATGSAFLQGGNTFGAAGNLGTNDNFALNLRTNGTTKLTVSTAGNLTFAQGANRTLNVAANATANGAGYNLTFAAGAADGTAAGNVGGVLALQGGAAAGSGNNNGGNITIDGGAKTGSGTVGNVILQGAGGGVAIGTSTINSGEVLRTYSAGNNTTVFDSANSTNVILNRASTSNYGSIRLQTGGTTHWAFGLQNNVSDNFFIGSGSSAQDVSAIPKFIVQPTGEVGIGTNGTLSTLLAVGGTTGNFTVDSSGNVVAQTSLTFAGASGTVSTSASNANLTLQANGTGIAALDTSGAGTVNVGRTNAATIQIGNTANTTTLTLDAGTGSTVAIANSAHTHTVNIATGAAAQTVTIGSTNGGSSLALQAGTGNLSITTQGTGTLGVGNNAVAQNLAIGNTTGATALNLLTGTGNFSLDGVAGTTYAIGASTTTGTITIGGSAQTGAISLGTGAGAGNRAVTVGSTANASTLTLQSGTGNLSITTQGTGTLGVGNNAVAQTIVVGNTTGATALTLQAGSAGIVVNGVLAATANSAAVCRDTSTGKLTACDANTTGRAFVQGGNTFGVAGDLGTNDNFALNLRTNGTTKLTVSAAGDLTFAQGANRIINVLTQTTSNTAGDNLTINSATGNGSGAGGTLTLQAANGGTTGAGGPVAIQGGTGGGGNTAGGLVTLTGGTAAGTGTGGGLTLQGGAASATATSASGAVSLSSQAGATGSGAAAGGASGTLSISTGNAGAGTGSNSSGGTAGAISVTAGAGGASTGIGTATAGAAVTINTGTGGAAVGTSGAGLTSANGGALTITTGNGGAQSGASGSTISGAGGAINLTAGNAGAISSATGTPGNGGAITLQAGTGGAGTSTSVNGNGGTLTIQGGTGGTGGSTTTGTAGGNLLLQGGAKGGTAAIGSVIVRANGTDSTTAFQVQNAASTAVLTVDTTNGRTYVSGTSGTLGQGYFTGTPAQPLGSFQSLNSGGFTFSFFGTNKYYNGTAWVDNGLGRLGSSFQTYNDAFTFYSFDTAANFTARLTVASGGNVGVGQGTSPSSLLTVAGTAPTAVGSGNGTSAASQGMLVAGTTGGDTSATTAGATGGAASTVTINTGTGGSATGSTANTTTGAAGGALSITTGNGGTTLSTSASAASGAGGAVTINSGNGGAATGASGAYTGGNGGAISLTAGTGAAVTSATAIAGTGGAITLQGGTGGTGGAAGGNVNGSGGAVTIKGGAAGLTTGTGGNLVLQGGAKGATGVEGSVIVKPQNNNALAFQIQNAAGTAFLTADSVNSTPRILIGAPTSTLSTAALVVTTQEITTRLLIGTTSNGADTNSGQIRYIGTFRNTKTIALAPEFIGMVLHADGANNVGTFTSDYDATNGHSYYNWTTAQAAAQDYDMYVHIPVPRDFGSFNSAGNNDAVVCYYVYTDDATPGNSIVTSQGFDTGNASAGTFTATPTSATTWQQKCSTTQHDFTTVTVNGSTYITFDIHFVAAQNKNTRIGEITLDYLSTF